MIWFTSDQHFNHANVIKYCNRPFDNVEEMNAELIRRHNVLVKPDDTIYMLGDFSMSPHSLPIVSQLNGIKHLVMGNHDRVHPIMTKPGSAKSERLMREFLAAGFASVELSRVIGIGSRIVEMHHMPYIGDQTEEARYLDWRPKDSGLWLLHGHVHCAWKVKGRMINVGVDQWAFAPVSLDEIKMIMEGINANGA